MNEWLLLGIQMVIGLLIAVVTALVTARAAVARHRSERWWDRKADAYAQLLEALFDAYKYEKRLLEELETGEDFNASDKQTYLERARRAWREIEKFTALGAFTISAKVADLLGKMKAHSEQDVDMENLFDVVSASVDAYDKYIEPIRDAAIRDLKVDGR